ncbi:phosphate signaling complex protein PhoU [candidate division KSB1 bacterium]|nr:phosphate signaling complex protein PhoU [candidate division KSB1 bacterium]NIR69862.1 phosphate signaling complex protein PhoU [candidate division KSB1 bacterium]NIS22981.1 phosphate signaling complex protein PhoU [candidate division KSB1 bacterium]NIT69839.1 phosphate signaling complex protein PhoU [candidate division KSB1 bacterium]NIU25761.1 phosphate signaling complex protein PhoU [candidate division KSB1 bacterium]
MERHLDTQIKGIKESLIKMAGLVESAIDKAIRALKDRDVDLAQKVMDEDGAINQLEIDVEIECRSLLARHQPVAVDLRFVMASTKINNDLERMGDHAVNIAQKALALGKSRPIKPYIDIPYMAGIVQSMVKDSIDAFVEGDVAKAQNVCKNDDVVDGLEVQINRELITYMMEDPKNISQALALSLVAKNLERIADLSTNIGEEVIYMVEAKTIKHHFEDVHIKK